MMDIPVGWPVAVDCAMSASVLLSKIDCAIPGTERVWVTWIDMQSVCVWLCVGLNSACAQAPVVFWGV